MRWLVADGDQWKEFYRDGVVRITGTGRRKLGDLRQYASKCDLAQALREKYREEYKKKKPAHKARLCFNFGHDVMVGRQAHTSSINIIATPTRSKFAG